jgi:hypothetical protein
MIAAANNAKYAKARRMLVRIVAEQGRTAAAGILQRVGVTCVQEMQDVHVEPFYKECRLLLGHEATYPVAESDSRHT